MSVFPFDFMNNNSKTMPSVSFTQYAIKSDYQKITKKLQVLII